MTKLLLLSGPTAVGKSGVANALIEYHGFLSIKSSTYLTALAKQQGLEVNRSNLQQIGDDLDDKTDYRWLIDAVATPTIASQPKHTSWLLDSVRKRRQVDHFRDHFGRSVFHVHLNAAESVIKQRYIARLAAGGERGNVSYETTKQHPNEISSRGLIEIADFVLDLEHMTPDAAALTIIERWPEKG
jgi:gluconate kinase